MHTGLRVAVPEKIARGADRHIPAVSSMEIEFTQLSDRGKVRHGNEDYLGCVQPASPQEVRTRGWLFALADGVGGNDFGEVASHTAVESLLTGFRESAGGQPHTTLLTNLVRAANTRVLEAGHATNPNGSAMATTIVACALRSDRAVVAHVGDSRCYLVRRGEARVLTRDHTVANEHLRMGLISSQEAADASTRHMLSRSLGSRLAVKVEVGEHQLSAGDVLVLCSDGLYASLTASEIAAIAGRGTDLRASAQRLVDIANERDGSDNISVQLVRILAVERVGMYRGRPYRLP